MDKMKKISRVLLLLLVVFSLAACKTTVPETEISYDGNLTILYGDETIEVAYNDIYEMESQTKDMIGISSSGEEVDYNFTGVLLNDVLASYELEQGNYAFIRLESDDGYAIDVPQEITASKDILLAYKENGEILEDKKMPLRSAIEGERSMFFVANLSKITLMDSADEGETALEKIIFLDTAATTMELEDYTYYESVDKAYKAEDLLAKYSKSDVESVKFVAVDDFEKTEMLDVLNQGYIKITGDNSPLFLSPDLPKGMHTKHILTMDVGDVMFVSLEKALEYFEETQVGEYKGVSLKDILSLTGAQASSYAMESVDGFQVEITHEELVQGIITQDDDMLRVRVPESLPKSYNLKYILSITPKGKQVAQSEETKDGAVGDITPSTSWEIKVSGLSDGSFTMKSDTAQSKLELVTIETSVVKNDQTLDEVWQGYRVLDVLSFLKVDSFESLEFIAGDGFSIELSSKEIDENSILAVVRDGEEMTDPTNLVRLVLDLPVSTNWLKGVAEIVVK